MNMLQNQLPLWVQFSLTVPKSPNQLDFSYAFDSKIIIKKPKQNKTKTKQQNITDWEAQRRGAAVAISAVSCFFRTGGSPVACLEEPG